jgi:cytochrome c peroxidase
MGGSGLTERQTLQVETFVDWTRDIDNPYKTLDQERLEKGSLIFYREEVGCGGCHSGARATDNQAHEMPSGVRMQTRSLIGAIASPPYMHDGSVESLRDVLKQAKSLGMGDTSSLNEQEFEDLLLYVKSL